MVVAQIKIRCKNSNCNASPTIWTKTFESEDELVRWTFAFEPQDIECPTCHTVAIYSDLELSADYSVTEPEPAGLNPPG
jgi:hypothetical protein